MTVIGVTGNIGSGKTTVSRLLSVEYGCCYLDADAIGKAVAEPGGEAYDELLSAFGEQYFGADGRLNRPKMAELVFHDEQELQKLNGIMHPAILRHISSEISHIQADEPERIIVVEAALLIEANYLGILDKLCLVWANDDVRLTRVMQRDNITAEQATARMNNQMPQQEKLQYADYVLHNNSGMRELKEELADFWRQFSSDVSAGKDDTVN